MAETFTILIEFLLIAFKFNEPFPLSFNVLQFLCPFFFSKTELNLPRFAEPIPNITVTIGKDALLACVVDNLKSYRVSQAHCNQYYHMH